MTSRDPTLLLKQRKTPRALQRVMTVEEVERLIAAAHDPLERAVPEVLYATGVRVSELVKLRLEDVDFGSRVMRVKKGKGGKDRIVLFGEPAEKAIRQYQDWRPSEAGYLFEAPARKGHICRQCASWQAHIYVNGTHHNFAIGKVSEIPTLEQAREVFELLASKIPGYSAVPRRPYCPVAIRDVLHRLAHRAGLGRVYPHALRRAIACHMLKGGGETADGGKLRAIQDLLGHDQPLDDHDLHAPDNGRAREGSREVPPARTDKKETQMSTRNKTSIVPEEIIPTDRGQVARDFKQMIAQIVEQKVSQAMSNHDSALLEPWFQSKEIENEIKRRQTVTEQRKWTYYFEDWGCIVCRSAPRYRRTWGPKYIDKAKMEALREKGMKWEDIAKELGVGHNTLDRFRKGRFRGKEPIERPESPEPVREATLETGAHKALGMCGTCYSVVVTRLRSTLAKHAPPANSAELGFMDTVRLAREALAPAATGLAKARRGK